MTKDFINYCELSYLCTRPKLFQIYCLARELFWPLKFRFIFSSNEDDLCHSTRMTFPGSIKDCEKALLLSSSLILAAEQTNFNMRRAYSIFGPLFSLEDHSFIIYSFLLDQLVLEASSWMLNSCSNIRKCFLPYDSQYRVFSQAVIKIFRTHQYSRLLICFTPFLK